MTACTCGIGGHDHSADCAVEVERRARPKSPITVVSTIVWRDGHALLGRRIGGEAAGVWCAPGGKADLPGRLVAHADRELREETGLYGWYADYKLVPLWREYTDAAGQNFTCVYFELHRPWGILTLMEPDKFAAWGWYHPRMLPDNMFPGEREIIMSRR